MTAMRRLSGAGWLLLPMVVALALRLLIPVGWMPVSTEHGIRLSWCSGFQPQAVPDPAQSHHSSHSGGHGEGHAAHGATGDETDKDDPPPEYSSGSATVCAFAAIAMAGADVPAGITEPSVVGDHSLQAPPFAVTIGQGLAAPPPPQTGPPALA